MIEDFAVSADGTKIGYRRVGSGAGLLIVHGSMSTGQNYTQLAEELASTFTVYLMDRRGRGLTGGYRPGHTVGTDVDDVLAVLAKVGAGMVFGVSVGGIIGLEAALTTGAGFGRLAVYEPPLFSDADEARRMTARLDRELASGDVAGALTTAMQGARMGPGFLNAMPHGLATRLTSMMIRATARKPSPYESFAELAPTLSEEGQVITEASRDISRYAAVGIPVLLLSGSRSSAFLRGGVANLAHVLPDARSVEIRGGDHSASWNADLRGKPGLVAAELRRFFSM
jgi:pimeloyl-ACP methyl ester carboxylesterase